MRVFLRTKKSLLLRKAYKEERKKNFFLNYEQLFFLLKNCNKESLIKLDYLNNIKYYLNNLILDEADNKQKPYF